MAAANPADIVGEFFWFERNLPRTMFDKDRDELMKKVEDNMKVNEAREALPKAPSTNSHFQGKRFPILDALSCKLGISLQNILSPPTQTCLLCGKRLTRNNKPALAALHTVAGGWAENARN